MKCMRFVDMDIKWKEAYLARHIEREMKKRAEMIKEYSERFESKKAATNYVDNIWWANKNYIQSWKPYDDTLFDCCDDCGCPTELMNCIYDKPANYGARDCGYICKCGKRHDHISE